ncbi:hypothetical protein ACWPKO_17555 [Coraliomargarita sp. W4R53]
MSEKLSPSNSYMPQANRPVLASEYLRAFSGVAHQIAEFDDFHEALRQLIQDDSYLLGSAVISDYSKAPAMMPDFENLDANETVVSVTGVEGNAGFLKYRGRRDGQSFGAEDLHLMGAIAGFVSVLTAQAHKFRKKDEASRVLQYLINQLPLGVVCFGAEGNLLVENKLATRLLSGSGVEVIRGALMGESLLNKGKVRLHLEVDGKLLYAEGRCLKVDEGLTVTAFILHDMSGQREKLMLQLERSVYRAESRGAPLTVALLEDRSEAGRLYRDLKASANSLQLDSAGISALDAYSCVCVFSDRHLRSVRYQLKAVLSSWRHRESITGALVSQIEIGDAADDSLAQGLIGRARDAMQALSQFVRPAMLVLDPFSGVIEALDLAAGEISSFLQVDSIEQAIARIHSGEFDGIFVDIDTYGAEGLEWLHGASSEAGAGFRIFYLSHKQPAMLFSSYGLGADAIAFQKPFNAEKLCETLTLQFDFA